jgi:hypothetical protein
MKAAPGTSALVIDDQVVPMSAVALQEMADVRARKQAIHAKSVQDALLPPAPPSLLKTNEITQWDVQDQAPQRQNEALQQSNPFISQFARKWHARLMEPEFQVKLLIAGIALYGTWCYFHPGGAAASAASATTATALQP